MANKVDADLSRRERQIMDALLERNPLSAKEIQEAIPEPPSYSAVRALLARMVEKESVLFKQEGAKYLYSPAQNPQASQDSAVTKLIKTFFKGSKLKAVTALLEADGEQMDAQEIAELERKIAQLKRLKK